MLSHLTGYAADPDGLQLPLPTPYRWQRNLAPVRQWAAQRCAHGQKAAQLGHTALPCPFLEAPQTLRPVE